MEQKFRKIVTVYGQLGDIRESVISNFHCVLAESFAFCRVFLEAICSIENKFQSESQEPPAKKFHAQLLDCLHS